MIGKKDIVPFSILCCMIFSSAAGLCFPEHPQAAVCRASFVIRAKVISVDWEEELKKKSTVAPTTAATTESITQTTSTAAATEAATTAAATEAATTVAAATKAATTAAATEAPTTAAATKAAATTAAATEAATTAAATKAATTAATEAATDQVESKENEISKTTVTTEKNGNQGDSKPIFKPAFAAEAAYSLQPKIIRLELRKLYKGLRVVNTRVGDQLNVTFASPHGSHLEVGKTYLITGFSYDQSLLMNECNWHEEWDELTTTQKLGLRRYYWLYCRCAIKFCPGRSCDNNPRACNWIVPVSSIGGKKADLLSSYSVCMVRCGRCGWHNPKEFVDCSVPF